MKTLPELQKDFRDLNAALIEEYEDAVKKSKEQQKQLTVSNEERASLNKKVFESAGFDTKLIDQAQTEQAEAFQKSLAATRSGLINRKSELLAELQAKSFYADLLNNSNNKIMQPFGASIMAADQKMVENIAGERGNPWVFPDNPAQIKLKATGHIGGWTCGQAYAAEPTPTANVWFHFVPDTTGLWNFSAIVAFHGFYVLRSDDSWYNCRSAWVKLTANVKVFQYSWQGSKNFTILNVNESNANYTKLFDSTQWLDTTAVLRAGDTAWILATITTDAMSLGSGTYAELNFQDGNGNFILPLFVAAAHT